MKKTLMAASLVLATVPGLAPLTGCLPTPPGQKVAFVAVAEFMGVAAIFVLWIWRKRIIRIKLRSATIISVVIAVAFFLAFGMSVWLHAVAMPYEEGRTAVFIPLWPSEHLAAMIEKAGSPQLALVEYGADAVIDASYETPVSLAITNALVLLAHQVMLLAPVVLCCGLALRTKGTGFTLGAGGHRP
jgi:hypothetical protein